MAHTTNGRSKAKLRVNGWAEIFIGVRGEHAKQPRRDRLAKSSPLALLSKHRTYACFPLKSAASTIFDLMNLNFNQAGGCLVSAAPPLAS
jgi:hypothetical protein